MQTQNRSLTKTQSEALQAAAKLFSHAKGECSDPNNTESVGIDIFTPYSAKRSIDPQNAAAQTMKSGLRIIHALSVKRQDDEGNVTRITCDTYEDSQSRSGRWWSVGLFEYGTPKEATLALNRILEVDPSAPIISIAMLQNYINSEPEDLTPEECEDAKATMKAFLTIKNLGRPGLASRKEALPPKFQDKEDQILMVYDPSGAEGNTESLWSNTAIQAPGSREVVTEEVS
jgi:hypothetical protein